MEALTKKKIRIGDIKKSASCCAGLSAEGPALDMPESEPCCQGAPERAHEGHGSEIVPEAVRRVSGDWLLSDYVGQIKCRISAFRSRYAVIPGLYAIGAPGKGSDIFVSANYKLSFDILRRALKGLNAWILVLDTKGINVWCAAGKGTFGTDELIRRIKEADLEKIVGHRRVIVPQLGAPGISAHEVRKKTGFRVYYGPVDASDIRAYLDAGYKAAGKLRRVGFSFFDRLVLTPMEIIPAMKIYPLYALLMLLIIGLQPSGILFRNALAEGRSFLILGLVSIFAGAFVTPLLLPFIPFRSFAVKGWITGMLLTVLTARTIEIPYQKNAALFVFTYLFFPMAASYIALQFTGSTVFTGISGVRKELRFAIPVYISAAFISSGSLVLFKLLQLGII